MALIICKECRRQFSDLAQACPGCGAPTSYSVDGSLPPVTTAAVPAQAAYTAQADMRPDESRFNQSEHTQSERNQAGHNETGFNEAGFTEPELNKPEQPPSAYQFVVASSDIPEAPPQRRQVGPFLLLGIFFLPWLFYWLLLRSGHSTLSRASGFLWLLLCTAGLLALNYSLSERAPQFTPAGAEPTVTEQPAEDLSNPVFYPLPGKNTAEPATATDPAATAGTSDNSSIAADAVQPANSQPPVEDSATDSNTSPPNGIYASSDDAEALQQKLGDCLQQQADTGSYTLSDKGKSVAKMISVCYSDFKPWFDQCLVNTHDARACNLDAIDMTTSILKLNGQ